MLITLFISWYNAIKSYKSDRRESMMQATGIMKRMLATPSADTSYLQNIHTKHKKELALQLSEGGKTTIKI
ncbi:hypothetical protein [Chlorobium ferrooxidans]|uniref:hypothetical protein n=1 Tax=Chlorobium ferrooxidans TaxID=84205 RepID=UPI00058BBE17|nr:hypothetical protein [Chlorobium ferrooxidans]